MRNFIKITVPITLIMLFISELFLRVIPVEDPYKAYKLQEKRSYILSQFKPYTEITFSSKEGLPLIDSIIHFSTNNYGYRGHELLIPKPDSIYRVFLVGGSTTECIYIDDSKSNNTLMEQYLKPVNGEVFNAGKAGDFTTDHIAMIAHRILHLEPDVIVLFCGINDLRKTEYDYSHRPTTEDQDIRHIPYYKLFLSELQLFRRFYNIFKTHSIETITIETKYKLAVASLKKMPYGTDLPVFNTKAYEKNLRSIIGMCKINNVQLLLVSQAVTWNSKMDDFEDLNWLSFLGKYRYKEEQLKEQMIVYNNIMKKLAIETNTQFYDLGAEIPATKAYFYDDCHFNNGGAKFYAEHVANLLMKNLQ